MGVVHFCDLGLWHVFGTATCIWPLLAAHSRTPG